MNPSLPPPPTSDPGTPPASPPASSMPAPTVAPAAHSGAETIDAVATPTAPVLPPPPPIGGHPTDLEPPTAAPAPAPVPTLAPQQPVPPSSTTPTTPSTARDVAHDDPERPRSRVPVVLLIVVAVAAGLTGWWLLGREDTNSASQPGGPDGPVVVPEAPPVPAPPAEGPGGAANDPLPGAPNDPVPPLRPVTGDGGAAAIQDAQELADQINADQGEAELLDELGLDPTGQPAAGTAGHEFRWSFADGVTATVVVDSVTGDHSYADSNGLSFRKVGELAFAQPTAADPWAMVDDSALAAIQRLGLDGPLTVDELVGGPAAAWASVSGDGSIWSVDEAGFQAADAAGRDAWVAALGLPVESSAGIVTIWISTAADGATVSTASIERDTTGETVVYELLRRFDESPGIAAPDL